MRTEQAFSSVSLELPASKQFTSQWSQRGCKRKKKKLQIIKTTGGLGKARRLLSVNNHSRDKILAKVWSTVWKR